MKNRFEKKWLTKNKMADKKNMANSAILRARDLKFLPKILNKYFKNRFEKNAGKKWLTQKKVDKINHLKKTTSPKIFF